MKIKLFDTELEIRAGKIHRDDLPKLRMLHKAHGQSFWEEMINVQRRNYRDLNGVFMIDAKEMLDQMVEEEQKAAEKRQKQAGQAKQAEQKAKEEAKAKEAPHSHPKAKKEDYLEKNKEAKASVERGLEQAKKGKLKKKNI